MKRQRTVPWMAVLAAAAAGCSDGTGPGDTPSVALSVAQAPAAQAGSPAASEGVPITDGQNTLDLTRVAVVVRKIELKRSTTLACESTGTGTDDSCEELVAGPLLLEIPVDGSVDQVVSVEIPPDTYVELEFEVHKPSDSNAEDTQFIQQNPDFADVSVRVEGTFNGETFVFQQDLNEKQEIDLSPPLVVEDGVTSINVTMQLDVSGWFRNSTGLIDPRTANKGGDNEGLVEENIRASIEAFRDDDRDGSR